MTGGRHSPRGWAVLAAARGAGYAARQRPTPVRPMSSKPTTRLKARLPRGFADRGPADIRRHEAMMATIRAVYELYGFEPVETPLIEYTDALGKFLPDQDRPNEGVFSFQDDDEQWLSLRYDLTAPLARYVAENFERAAEALSQLSLRLGVPQREAGAGPLPPVHAVRRRHGRHAGRRGRRRDVHDDGRHDGGARHRARRLCDQGQQPQGARRRDGGDRPRRRRECRAAADRAARDRQARQVWARRACAAAWLGAGTAARTRAAISRRAQGWTDRSTIRLLCSSASDAWSQSRFRRAGDGIQDGMCSQTICERWSAGLSATAVQWKGVDELRDIAALVDAAGYGDDRVRIDPSVVRGLEYYTGPVFEAELTCRDPQRGGPDRALRLGRRRRAL